MKNECSVIRDLLPLYAENMVSEETAAFVAGHLDRCPACREAYEQTRDPRPPRERPAAPLLLLRKKLKIKKIQTAVLTALFVAAVLVSAFALLDAPEYFPYSPGLVTAEPADGRKLRLTFALDVTDFDCALYPDPEGEPLYYCDIQAWTSLWDRWFSGEKGRLSTVLLPQEPYPIIVEYLPNDGTETVRIYGDRPQEGRIALPRLSLGYYLILAGALLALSVIVWLLAGKSARLRLWAERAGLYPVSYLISHVLVSGIRTVSYSLPRDFFLTVFLSILLYSGLLLAHNIWRLKKEIGEISRP